MQGPAPALYFAEQDNEIIILLCAGDKGTQSKDIKLAKEYWRELKERSDE
jgi:putative addiction module killer protein